MVKNNDIELRSEEVQEVMNRIPPAILRWGITVIAFIVTVFFAIAYFIEVPVTEECPFTMIWDDDSGKHKNMMHLSPSVLQSVLFNDTTEVRLHSDMFPEVYSSGISTVITANQISLNPAGYYEAVFEIHPEIETYLSKSPITISGKATIIVTNKTLLGSFKL